MGRPAGLLEGAREAIGKDDKVCRVERIAEGIESQSVRPQAAGSARDLSNYAVVFMLPTPASVADMHRRDSLPTAHVEAARAEIKNVLRT
jgi:hypothetical protein